MATQRGQHFTDWVPDPLQPRQRRRTIRAFQNYQTSYGGVWLPTVQALENAQGTPPAWGAGNFDFQKARLQAQLQTFVGDATDPSNRALWGMRRADTPQYWLNWKPYQPTNANVEPVYSEGDTVATFVDMWTNTDLRLTFAPNFIKTEIVLKAPGHPASFDFTYLTGGGLSAVWSGNAFALIDPQAAQRFAVPAPVGWDSSTDHFSTYPTGERPISIAMTDQGKVQVVGRQLDLVRWTPDPNDIAAATYPVTLDPTSTYQGSSDVEDGWLFQTSPNNTYGGNTVLYAREADINSVLRITGSLPASGNNVTDFRLQLTNATTLLFQAEVYAVSTGNNWQVDSASGTAVANMACWNDARYTSLDWDGGDNGCGVSGTDYDADGSPPTYSITSGSGNQQELSLGTTAAQAWINGTRTNNGVVLKGPAGATTNHRVHSTDAANAAYRPLFTMDYEAAPSAASFYYNYLIRKRRE